MPFGCIVSQEQRAMRAQVAYVFVVVVVLGTAPADAGPRDGDRARTATTLPDGVDPLHLSTVELMQALDAPAAAPRLGNEDGLTLFGRVGRGPVGVQGFMLLEPPSPADTEQGGVPTFALVAHARGRAVISLTRPGVRVDPGQSLVLQRTLISDLFAGRRFSLSVYEDHTLSTSALRFMAVGARVSYRPELRIPGWHVRLELMTGYGFDTGASAFLAITGVPEIPKVPTLPAR
jgi:hypothetical protein